MSKLSDVKVRKLKMPGRHPDGDTLYLKVSPSGNKSWIQRLIINGRRRDLGLGVYPLVSLAEARGKAMDNRALARAGDDPMAMKREERLLEALPTFKTLGSTSRRTFTPGRTPSTGRSGSPPLRPMLFQLLAPSR